MKKLLCVALVFVLVFALASCVVDEPTITVDADGYVIVNGVKTEYKIHTTNPNKIEYSISLGTKIDTLPVSEQEKIDAYVADCKTLYKYGYAQHLSDLKELDLVPYLSFTDVHIYDFRNVDENTLDGQSLSLWNSLKKFYPESRPMMYVELAGYHACFNSDLLTPISGGSIIYGFFIFEDDTVILNTYDVLCRINFVYKLIEGTALINCGNKYSEEFNHEQFNVWVNSMSEYRSRQEMMKKLRVEE